MTGSARTGGSMAVVPGRTSAGDHYFSVLVKRSYRIVHGATATRDETDRPLRLVDRYADDGNPSWAVVEHESDMAPLKELTDVVVIGRAHAPGEATATSMLVGVQVGDRRKLLRVTGDRICHFRAEQPPTFSDPQPFRQLDIRYDRAYGGRDERSDASIPFFYPRNDMGRGVALRNVKEAVQGLTLPNIEDPDDLLTPERVVIGDPYRWPEQPLPHGLGWTQRTWYPRSALLGSLPAFLRPGTVTREERAGRVPPDHVSLARQMRLPPYEARFANGASPGLSFESVAPDETIRLRGLTPEGQLDFRLPGDVPVLGIDLGSGSIALEPCIHTVSIEPEAKRLDMLWCGTTTLGPAAKLATLKRLQPWVQ